MIAKVDCSKNWFLRSDSCKNTKKMWLALVLSGEFSSDIVIYKLFLSDSILFMIFLNIKYQFFYKKETNSEIKSDNL